MQRNLNEEFRRLSNIAHGDCVDKFYRGQHNDEVQNYIERTVVKTDVWRILGAVLRDYKG